jgi:hypothetical protein
MSHIVTQLYQRPAISTSLDLSMTMKMVVSRSARWIGWFSNSLATMAGTTMAGATMVYLLALLVYVL